MRLDAAQRTSTVVVDLDSHGERTFTFMVRPSADLFLQPRISRRLPPVVAARLLHRSQRGAEPQHDIRGDGGDKARRGYVASTPYPQRPVAGCAGPSRLSRPGAGLADAIKLSEEELAFISGSDDIVSGIARLNARFQPTLLLVTR